MFVKRTIRIASRRSQLAMRQTEMVSSWLREQSQDIDIEIVPVVTKGDRILDVSLSKVGGKGLFVSEIEQLLLDGAADVAVHSMKDVPVELADGLILAGIPAREDPRDALISRSGLGFKALPPGAVIGTSSLRRAHRYGHSDPIWRFATCEAILTRGWENWLQVNMMPSCLRLLACGEWAGLTGLRNVWTRRRLFQPLPKAFWGWSAAAMTRLLWAPAGFLVGCHEPGSGCCRAEFDASAQRQLPGAARRTCCCPQGG